MALVQPEPGYVHLLSVTGPVNAATGFTTKESMGVLTNHPFWSIEKRRYRELSWDDTGPFCLYHGKRVAYGGTSAYGLSTWGAAATNDNAATIWNFGFPCLYVMKNLAERGVGGGFNLAKINEKISRLHEWPFYDKLQDVANITQQNKNANFISNTYNKSDNASNTVSLMPWMWPVWGAGDSAANAALYGASGGGLNGEWGFYPGTS